MYVFFSLSHLFLEYLPKKPIEDKHEHKLSQQIHFTLNLLDQKIIKNNLKQEEKLEMTSKFVML